MKFELKEKELIVFLEGRVDSTNAEEVEKEIENIRKSNEHDSLILDLEELEYISSAGLRLILRIIRQEKDFKIVNAGSEVYEIFEMTGFTEMMDISKAYKRMSVEGCEVVGEGANGKVYRIDRDTIVKVYLNPDSLDDIHKERALAKRAFVLGVPTAISYDVVRVGEGYGSVFELLNSKSLAKLIKAEPENLDKYVDEYVDLMKTIHGTVVKPEDMPSMKEVAVDWAKFLLEYLPEEKGHKLVKLMEAVPEDLHMMHGDYHIKNVMMQNGEALLIDMDTLCHGHPIFELGSMFNAYLGFSELDHSIIEGFLGITYEQAVRIWERTLPLYLGTDDPEKVKEVEEKAMLVGYTRLMRRLIRRNGLNTEKGKKEIECYKNHILDLLDRIDDLTF